MHIVSYLLAVFAGLFGLMWIMGSQGSIGRIITGVILLGVAAGLVYFARMKTPEKKIVQQIDLSGDVQTEQLSCKACGATLDSESVSVQAGAVFVKCPYCGTSYQIEEEPKW
jgi:Zn finger protein HypA/HybF involved in hydrogenase expression